MLTAKELASMRAAVALYLPDVGIIQRPTPIQNAIGEATADWAIEGTVDCRLVFAERQPQFGGKQAEQGGLDRLAIAESWQVVVAHDTDLLLNDRITLSVADGTGASWGLPYHGLSLADGQAFLRVEGVDLSPFAGVEGVNTLHTLVLTDQAGKTAQGYIGNQDAAEALGGDLFDDLGGGNTKGNFNAGDSVYSWMAYGSNTVEVEDQGGGDYALKITYADTIQGAYLYLKDIADLTANLTVGKLYKLTFDVKVNAGQTAYVRLNDGSGTILYLAIVSETTFQAKTVYFTAEAAVGCYLLMYPMGTNDILWLNNIVLEEVTDVGTDAVHVVSTRHGSTRNWTSIESGFDHNDSAYTFSVLSDVYEIVKIDTGRTWAVSRIGEARRIS